MTLAAERTYLAYLRTGLALMAAGVAVAGALPEAGAPALRRGLGVLLVLLGTVTTGTARSRWDAIDRAMRRGDPLPRARTAQGVGTALLVVGVIAMVAVMFV